MALLPDINLASLLIPLQDVLDATNNFDEDNIISSGGGFGPAYKGLLLQSGKRIKIVARRFDRSYGLGELEFWNEVTVLSDLSHPNVVSMIGYCDEEGEKIIITTYEARGSLGFVLNSPNLTWIRRLKICFGVARALRYLHYEEGRDYGVIHRNINCDTILLDENWEPKLSGFEIAIKQPVNRMDRVIPCEALGMEEYMDPEIEKTKGVTYKSDIYSFGVVLFEILCGRSTFIVDEVNRFVAPLVRSLQNIIDPNLWNQMSPQSFAKYSNTAYSCIKEERARRLDTDKIASKLEKALGFQLRRENLARPLFCFCNFFFILAFIIVAVNKFPVSSRLGFK